MSFCLLIAVLMSSCTKDFLEKKTSAKLLVPEKLEDFQALLDNNSVMNLTPTLGMVSADDFYTTNWKSLAVMESNAYLWLPEIYQGAKVFDWTKPYAQIFYANVVLEGLEKLPKTADSQQQWNNLKGSALFFRALALYNLAQEFCPPYHEATAAGDVGIPVPLSADVNIRPGRGSVKLTYEQIVNDLNVADQLMLSAVDKYKTRPGKAAVKALLAKVYLLMQNYEMAKAAASACLNLKSELMNYNDFIGLTGRPFPSDYPNGTGNVEVLFNTPFISTGFVSQFSSPIRVDDDLYHSYKTGDLRKTLFFAKMENNTASFQGSYTGSRVLTLFGGLTVDETYLIRAECFARLHDATNAMKDLNTLLVKRWDKSFQPLVATTPSDALKLILEERRKELVGRGTRWSDLRRLNMEPEFAVALTRIVNGQTYNLPPNDKRYVFAIPDEEIKEGVIEQNLR